MQQTIKLKNTDMDENDNFVKLITKSADFADEMHSKYLLLEHILYTALDDNEFNLLLTNNQINVEKIKKQVKEYLDKYPLIETNESDDKALESETLLIENFISIYYGTDACNKFIKNKRNIIFCLNVLSSLIMMEGTYAQLFLVSNNVNEDLLSKIYETNVDKVSLTKSQLGDNLDILKQLFPDGKVTQSVAIQAVYDYLPNVLKNRTKMIGREVELELAQQILMRKDKSNLIVIGKTGIGKTRFVQELTKIMASKDGNKKFYQLDMAALTGGIMIKGELETRVKELFKKLDTQGDVVLFIDNIHTICSSDYSSTIQGEIANAIKPMMSTTSVKIIGTTTNEDFRKNIEPDEVFAKYFYKLPLKEPSIDDTYKIVQTMKKTYEKYFGCKYPKKVLDEIVDCSKRFITNRCFPEKALDLMDMVGALSKYNAGQTITIDMVHQALANMTGTPLTTISESEQTVYQTLEETLKKEIIGQDDAVSKVSDSIIISRSGLRESNKTASSLMFIGSSGCGKTELCKVLSKALNLPLIRFDMSEYMEDHSVSKLLGAPPGYKDSGNGKAGNGLLINAIDENPSCILLLDEIEKANTKVHNLLLQVMDNGHLTSSIGKTVSFENVFLIMTSNVGSQFSQKSSIGFGNRDEKPSVEAFKQTFMPEFRSRIDATVVFNDLSKAVMTDITRKFMQELTQILAEKKVKFGYDEDVVTYITDKAIKENNGARPIKHIITNEIKNKIAKDLVLGEIKAGQTMMLTMNDDTILFKRGKK